MHKTTAILFLLCLVLPMAAQRQESISRPKIGLVLGGGGAKGAAEIGVLKVIEDTGIPIDYIAGTSIGAVIGGLYAVGYRAADIDSMFHQQAWIDLFGDRRKELSNRLYEEIDGVTYILGFPVYREKMADGVKTIGIMHGDNVTALLDSMMDNSNDIQFDSLPIPFRCVAVDIRKMREVELTAGSLPQAIRASMSIPGAFKPIEKDNMLLVDGGLLNNLPVDVVRRMGADIVIAVDLTQHKHETRETHSFSEGNTLQHAIEWLAFRPDLKKYGENCRDADIYINPDLTGYDVASFTSRKITEMINRGADAAEMKREELNALKIR